MTARQLIHIYARTDAFFEHSSQLGWFLSVTRFRHALLLPEDNVSRPISALVNTVYLIGATNMHQITGKYPPIDENVYLQRALGAIGHALEDAPSQKVVQVIQARVLLALYHYSMDTPQHASNFVDIIALMLPPPQDQVEEGERINALWTVFTICRCWGIAFGAPILISDNDAFGTQIDTPWPLDMETYERGPVLPNFRTSRTLRNFLAGMNTSWPWENHSLLAQISNASALFDHATHLSSYRRLGTMSHALFDYIHVLTSHEYYHADIPDMDAFYTNFMAVDSRIDQFRSQLYALPNLVDADSGVVRTMHVIHCLANTASIQLHSAFAQHNVASRNKCFMAAQAIVQANFSVRAHEFLIIDPVLGIVWGAACQVFIRELVFMRSIPANATLLPPDHETEVWLALNQLQTTMAIFAPVCAFIGACLLPPTRSQILTSSSYSAGSQLDKVQQELMGL
ncbi:hypothetical protein EWM64_g2253 [Hericium alpestre]|uniref:Transcription factor domain-containing protein n=1 Tax=Hericium alpestre TaxID=135208 RepID=A0A4Z0A5Z0_9AGAM|nr:hypothetical protein EWM64_g2253 [Hericium alpestre]